MSLKFTEDLYHDNEDNNSKFGEVMTFRFKIDMRNLTNF